LTLSDGFLYLQITLELICIKKVYRSYNSGAVKNDEARQ
jgi:hypothetical protein